MTEEQAAELVTAANQQVVLLGEIRTDNQAHHDASLAAANASFYVVCALVFLLVVRVFQAR
jgi:hypothetical protein